MIRQSKSAYVESTVVLKNTQPEFARGDTERLTNPPYSRALLKNTLLSPPETKERKSLPDLECRVVLKNTQLSPPDIKEKETSPEEVSIPAFACSAVLKKTQLSPPDINKKAYLLSCKRPRCKD